MKKRILVIIALMLVICLSLSSCGVLDTLKDLYNRYFGGEVELTDKPLEANKIVDFANGAPDASVLFESDGWSNGDVFNVVWKSHNVHYENGIMRLGITEEKASAWLNDAEVDFNYTAGEARTENYYHYGDYEVSMKPSANAGTASTFFVCTGPYDLKDGVPNAHDEIDIEFLGKDTTHVQFNFFVNGVGGNEYMYDLGFDAAEEFHTYGFRWLPDSITWFVDGEPVYKVTTDKSAEEGKNLRVVDVLPQTAGRMLANYWCGNERAWGWMGAYQGETKDNGTQYQWIATSAEGAPLNPPAQPPVDGGDEIDWSAVEPIAPGFESAEKYVVAIDGNKANVTYTDVGGSDYKPIEMDITDVVAGKNYVYLKVTNNGTETVNVRVNLYDPTLTGNNQATNISATMNGVGVYTDLSWGGSFFDIAAGETAELVVNFGVGATKLQLMIDSSRNDATLRSGDVTVEDIKFTAVGDVEVPHKCEDADADGKCDGCGADMPTTPPPAPQNPVSGNLNLVLGDFSAKIDGNVNDGYGVNVNDDGTISVEYTNIKGNSYKNIWANVSSIAGSKSVFTMKVTNNGTEAAKVRIDIESQTQTSANTTCCNVSATQNGEYVYTDTEWGGSTFVIEAGATATLEVVYDASKLPTNIKIMIDSCQWDDETFHAGSIVISELNFSGEYAPAHECESVCAECGKCLDAECTEEACADKCAGHSVEVEMETLEITFGSEGNYKTPVDMVDLTNVYIGDNGGNNAQVKQGYITVYLPAGSKLTVNGYPGYTAYNINGGELITDQTYVYETAEAVTLTINADPEAAGHNYFYSLVIEYPKTEEPTPDPDPEPDTGLQFDFWTSSGDYTTSGNNIKYNGAGNAYSCVGSDIASLAAGKTTFTVTITNNGAADSKVRVDIQGTTQVGNHTVLNTGATGGDVWTDMDWGGSSVTVAPGQSVTLVITYDVNTDRGAPTNIVIFVDAARGDGNTYSSDITLSGMAFSGEASAPADPEPVEMETLEITFGSEGNYKTPVDMVDLTNVYIGDNGGNNAQVKQGYITVYLPAGSKLTVNGYPGYTAYNINGGELITDQTYVYETAEAVTLTINADPEAQGKNYFYSLVIEYPKSAEPTPDPAPSIPEGEYLSYNANDVYTLSATPDQYVNSLTVSYTAAESDTYLNVNTWIQDKAAGKATLSVYIKNNGTEEVKITVKLETDGTGKGETTVTVAAGETLHVELAYTEDPAMLFFFIATGWNDNAHVQSAGNVTISGVEFK